MYKLLFEEQDGWRAVCIRTAQLFSIFPLIFVFLRFIGNFLPRLTLPSCELDDSIANIFLVFVFVLIIFCITLLIYSFGRHKFKNYVSILLLVSAISAAYFIQEAGYIRDDARQARCAARTVDEAIVACRANPRVLRKGYHGSYPKLILVAPGNTDAAWDCLERWGLANGSTSLTIDESVYIEYRKSHKSDK